MTGAHDRVARDPTTGWRTVARLEWRVLRRDPAALGVLGLFAVLLLATAIAGGRYATEVRSGLERAARHESERHAALRAQLVALDSAGAAPQGRDPRDPLWMGQEGAARVATLPPAPLAAIAVGQRDLHPQALRVDTGVHVAAERETETPLSGPSRLTTGAFDPAFLFVVLFPLVVIALTYELLTGERERGTLAMLLAQPISQRALVVGKAGARLTAVTVVTLLFALFGLLVAGADLSAGAADVGLYALVLGVWALFWFAAAIAVNAWGRTSAGNALLLFGLWLLVVVLVPGLVRTGVDLLHPPPSRVEVLHEAREAAQAIERELAGIEGRHDRDPRSRDHARRLVEAQRELAERTAPVLAGVRSKLEERRAMLAGLRFLSPAIAVQLALEDIAGSGAVRHQRFDAQVDRLHSDLQAFFFAKVRAGARLSIADLERIPSWRFEEEPLRDRAARILVGVLGLLVGAGALFGLALPGLRRIGRLAA